MIQQLHILTSPPDEYVQRLLESLRRDPGLRVETADLNVDAPDYDALVESIFAADSIATW